MLHPLWYGGFMSSFTEEKREVLAELKTIIKAPKDKQHGEIIGKIASAYYYAKSDSSVLDIAEDMEKINDVQAVGITDKSGRIIGLIARKILFDFLSKPFGRDLYHSKCAGEICSNCMVYDFQSNIYTIAEEIEEQHGLKNDKYFAISKKGRFYGIFSTKDILIYLSGITQKDIQLARKLQSNIVKEDLLFENNSFAVCAVNRSAKGVSGDFYDVREYNQGRWLFTLCDVSGKGVSASLVTAAIGGLFSAYDFSSGISTFIQRMNSFLLSTFGNEKFVTGVFAELNEETGELTIFDMGHSLIYLFRDGRFFRLNTAQDNNIPLGIADNENSIPSDKIKLEKDDLFMIVTDGLIEQVNESGEQYGSVRFAANVGRYAENGITKIKDEVLKDISRYKGRQPLHDDMTMIILSFKNNLSD